MIASYELAMIQALAISDPVARSQAVAAARANQLSAAANKPLSGAVVDRVDSLLGLPATP
ncbi:hypothetical protein [Neoroseomonas oryzicola]|uniref:Uncharacterized protein n=1 Tax=Neoroseomonas oryzicola TaxID=535904 RepID=A0A9X9WNX3_9PROT|nr:hypothetical protein [Neoroseomonas oryzicola]MBR0662033.1 hypothetical protein [Neoroseomonas oryzicola]NKE18118.1 hypothetical protein [Neoroseomonas oryzicola]